ncbi:glycosyltransferase family 8 protein [Veillonella sp. R32]|uniref:glycosyltransferase family 8 protein n=1 Tax=Veillonella sp. R32 TaxID=2021312 RepID=UPI0013898C22|nr:glycosyltransferase [Veillonella sp. R32]KAF1680124.1 hypothetical protein VER_08805 [Veillonella sp. R32]
MSIEELVKSVEYLGSVDKSIDFSLHNNIAICSDENALYGLGVLAFSILKNIKSKCIIHIFFNGSLQESDKKRLERLTSLFDAFIVIYYMNNECFENLYTVRNITTTAYYRLVVPYILDFYNISKVLYLDTDMLVLSDISDLFTRSVTVVYVVKNSTSKPLEWEYYRSSIGMLHDSYFNSGMMLINVVAYKEYDIGQRAIKLLKQRDFKYMDQDVLNILLENLAEVDLSVRYNCTMSVVNNQYMAERRVDIVHFTGNKKPWKLFTEFWGDYDSNNEVEKYSWKYKYYKLWRIYAEASPWNDVELEWPKDYHEWRYLSKAQIKNKQFIKGVISYYKYLKNKKSNNC